ncbi:dihydrofolate reductase [Thioclava sp. SK-1]|uniref:dihydrofolate reductase n=1 Tax=Thioclava sp. SK-1 TaxID=1889770 RepID=UPI0008252C32|nr:dihydrofolate reductase [Thioclava sp. SK-1]OCX60942.1 dihydrofolate reductase [Thioclava sp. SK-1]
MITLIVARARNGAIGKGNEIPWHAPQDLKMFQRETMGGAIIMGRNTWDSLPFKPLKNRFNCVVSKDTSLSENVFQDIKSAISACHAQGHQRIYGIGGEGIYKAMLPLAQRLMITEVDLTIDAADAYFPEIDEADWTQLARRTLPDDRLTCTLRELVRKDMTPFATR